MNEYIKKAQNWLLNDCIRNGLASSYNVITKKYCKPYPEVTGYLLSYFAKNYPNDVAQQVIYAADTLIDIQDKKTGGFPTSTLDKNILYVFDTSKIMHGFCSLYIATKNNKYLNVAIKCADFILSSQIENGGMYPVFNKKQNCFISNKTTWASGFSYINVKNIEDLLLLFEITSDIKYKQSAEKLRDFGLKNCDTSFTHPGGYCLEGLFAAGEYDFVKNKLQNEVIPRVDNNGFISYDKELSYAYVSGSVQMGILLANTGFIDLAVNIRNYTRRVQEQYQCGGLIQFANADCSLNFNVHTEMNSWGTKYFCELERLLINY